MARARGRAGPNPADEAFARGLALVEAHPLYGPLRRHAVITRHAHGLCPPGGFAVVLDAGEIHAHPTRLAAPEEWARVLAHCLLHLAFEHFEPHRDHRAWNAACCTAVERFLEVQKLGRLPAELQAGELPAGGEAALYQAWCERGLPDPLPARPVSGPGVGDLWWSHGRSPRTALARRDPRRWSRRFAEALTQAVGAAVARAAGHAGGARPLTLAERGRRWFVDHYPLLGALAVAFDLVEDPVVLSSLQVSIAAVDAEARELYVDGRRLDDESCRFVLAHELLHVGLRHAARRQGRDPFLWNVACDYVINGWLVEMGVGALPDFGALHDPALKGLSAEAVYDRIVGDLRRYRKVATLRGMALGDLLGTDRPVDAGADLDAFYRRCLAQGLEYHQAAGRGLLPAGLVREIQALAQPPIPWDVALARWFDGWLRPLEARRSYARPSRRQQATPDIPRPGRAIEAAVLDGRTFGVVLDTSGSMDPAMLARALGAIASYAAARDVPAVRVVFCDAAAYDAGYLPAEEIAGRVRVRGRGGTRLQPGVDLFERAADFPASGPLLVITDGACDQVRIGREHAFLLPRGRSLPFAPAGPVFRMA